MMSKPAPTASKAEETKPAGATTTKKSPHDAVADLERRLAELSTHIPEAATAAKQDPPPSIATAFNPTVQNTAPPPAVATDAATAPVKGGKNALLVRLPENDRASRFNATAVEASGVSEMNLLLHSLTPICFFCQARIMAAQERAKQAQNAPAIASSPSKEEETPPAYTDDLLMMDNVQPPPPVFDPMLLPPPTENQPPPPAFDDSLLPPPASTTKMVFDPLAPSVNTMMAPPEPSAPSFEDLDFLGGQTIMQPPPPPPAEQ